MSPRELLGGWAVGEAELGSTLPLDKALHWESFCLSHPAAVSKKQISGSLIHPLVGADTSGKSCFSMTLLIRLFLEHSISICSYQDTHWPQNSCVCNAVDNPLLFATQDFSIILILTSTSWPGLLPLITGVPWSLPCLRGSSSMPLSGCCTIIDTKPQDYLVTLPRFYFVCLQVSSQACIKQRSALSWLLLYGVI